MGVRIRFANLQDAQALKELICQLGYVLTIEEIIKKLKIYLEPEDYMVLVADLGGKVIGFIAAHLYERFVVESKGAYIMGLIVDRGYRGKRLGSTLLKSCEEEALKRGAYIMELTSGTRRSQEGTHRFYQQLGYGNQGEMSKVYFRKTLLQP